MNDRNVGGSLPSQSREIIPTQPELIEQASSTATYSSPNSNNVQIVQGEKMEENGTSPKSETSPCDSAEKEIQNYDTIFVSQQQNQTASSSTETNPTTYVSELAADVKQNVSSQSASLGLTEACKEFSGEEEEKKFSQQDMADALLVSQNSPGLLSSGNAEVLVTLLSHPDNQMQMSALNGIKKSSSFKRNQVSRMQGKV